MSEITFYTRSFHPDHSFGAGGLFFEGDDRDFSFSPSVTARIWHLIPINLQTAQVGVARCESDPSANLVADKIVNAHGQAAETILNQIPGVEVDIPLAPPMANDYSQPRKKPRHKEHTSITAFTEDGDQTANITIIYAGKNFAFYGADSDVGHAILGGPLSNEEADDPGSGTIADGWIPYNGVVPDLDVTNQLYLMLDRDAEVARVQMTMTGDGFPNAESFIIDSSDNVLGLATHIRTGTALTQLPGGRAIRMCMTLLEKVDWTKTDTLGSGATAISVYDYMSYSTTEVTEGDVGRSGLNNAHLKRDASGNLLRQVQDNIPLPSLRNYEHYFE